MPRFWPRLLKSVLPVALLAGAGGYAYAVAAGAYVADGRDDGEGLREKLLWRVPFSMAAWAGGFTLLFELFRHLWVAKPAPTTATERGAVPPAQPDAEQLLLQLLEQAEAAEKTRESQRIPVLCVNTDTPAPAALPTGQPVPAV